MKPTSMFKNFFSRPSKDRRTDGRPENGYNATILIVDDSRTVIASLKKTLQQGGFSTITAINGEEGVQMAKQHKPNMILMDLVMPGINGFQATRMIRRDPETENIPIIIISGNEQASEKFWGTRIGASGFLPKPITRDKLFEVIAEILDLEELTNT